MAFSVNTPVGDGVTKQFALNFTNGLFSRDSVHVFVEGEVDGLGQPIERTFTYINDGLIELDGDAPSAGLTVEIRRIMDKDEPAVDFEDGEILTEATADRALDHLLNLVHELLDGYGFNSLFTDLDLNGNVLSGVKNAPGDPTSAVNREGLAPLILTALQQVYDGTPLPASAFSPVSWHDQLIESDVVIPDGKNAWSFGPQVDIQAGTTVTIGQGSFWTIANGEQQ